MPHVPLPGFHGRHPFSAVYVIEQDQPWSETERDVQVMRGMGYDLVTLWPAANSWLATRPDEFVTTDTRRVLDLLHQHGMQAVVQVLDGERLPVVDGVVQLTVAPRACVLVRWELP